MIPTTISWLLWLVVKLNIVIAILYVIKLVIAKLISATVNWLYDYWEEHPMMYTILWALFSVTFVATVILIWISL